MIELEVYARGLRAESCLLELRGQMDLLPRIRYKVDEHHDLVYLEIDEPESISLREIANVFINIGLEPRFVGQVPEGLAEDSKTKQLN